ncbi:MAG: hypothetical protein E7451_06095 [Ruminococcaceae bacterium]|nr:hypothetical protein [Oscillospiraceae bacterium]
MYRKIKKGLLIAFAVFLVFSIVFGLYAGDYYHADLEAINALSIGMDYEKMERLEDGSLVFYPAEYDTAVIFYPGGKVEATAYIPLMEHCAQEGILSVLMPMPFNLAVLAKDAAEGIPEQFPEVEHWYMAGHSLGGSMAASFTAENTAWVDGLILLAAYSTEPLEVPVLSIYGSEDGVLNMEKYEKYRSNLPADFEEHVIDGGSHAGFGLYGAQDGDGTASMTNHEQIARTAELIAQFVK